jgi:ParB family transcriptional regulator, chromosome partitioning protein
MKLQEVELGLVDDNPRQPRNGMSDEKLEELMKSIELHGLLQPIIGQKKPDGRFTCIAGHRRKIAYERLGRTTIPTIIIEGSSTEQNAVLAIIENKEREGLSYVDLANAVLQVLADQDGNRAKTAIALNMHLEPLGRLIEVGKLPDKVKETAKVYQTSMRDLLVIGTLKDEKTMVEALAKVKQGLPLTEIIRAKTPRQEPIRSAAPEKRRDEQIEVEDGQAGNIKPEGSPSAQPVHSVVSTTPEPPKSFIGKPGITPQLPAKPAIEQESPRGDRDGKIERTIPNVSPRQRAISTVDEPEAQVFKVSIRNPDRPAEMLEAEVTVSLAIPSGDGTVDMFREALANCFNELEGDGKLIEGVAKGILDGYSIRHLRRLIRESVGGMKNGYQGDVAYLQTDFGEEVPPSGSKLIELSKIVWEAVGKDPEAMVKLLGVPICYEPEPERFSEKFREIGEYLTYRLEGKTMEAPPEWEKK